MKLNKQQLEYIRTFVRQQGFTAIDLQIEIIDHVACSIEEKLGENPALTFEEALQQTHAAFGVSGFGELKAAMAKSLREKYFGQMSLELKRWLSFPAVLVVGSFAIILYQLFFLITTSWLFVIMGFAYLAFSVGAVADSLWLQSKYNKLMAMQFANQFVFLPTFLFYGGGGWSAISHQFTRYPEEAWVYACLFACLTLFFTFLFAAFLRITSYAIRKCRALERHELLF